MRSLAGTVIEAITLRSGGAESTEALTDNYLKMKISGHLEANRWMEMEVGGVDGEMLSGRPILALSKPVEKVEPRFKPRFKPTTVTQECTETNNRIDR